MNDVVDDLRIFVKIQPDDGPGGTLASAGPCVTRGLGGLPILGAMTFDSDDMDQLATTGGLLPVVIHEMGHLEVQWKP